MLPEASVNQKWLKTKPRISRLFYARNSSLSSKLDFRIHHIQNVTMSYPFLVFASINGFIAVALGAFATHGLQSRLTPELLNTFQTGVQYQMYHALALFGVGLLMVNSPNAILPKYSGYLFLVGIILFSGSLYVLSLTGIRWLGAITPVGGLAFLAAWGLLFWFAVMGTVK